mmetsp:Transcript_822/g.1224  ORF Transcript_822/g.1224 Transcript_822/m.1224 type:complete len:185 (+) Transcript_822:90-644(+)|eukprot:CAMPEP_0117754910 /NCGR_PEP_ID=MMETSP0947-20121206/13131_1 /TAXON_ID=44440 /ORGANISM="Chattonella subsalsa, Strain CCMP2191" /LENGTH=184 /DNA_ID=CAMNT_0005574131 /DNA_START=89 /DNA_END=643 /DNA_ORIENTATION=-
MVWSSLLIICLVGRITFSPALSVQKQKLHNDEEDARSFIARRAQTAETFVPDWVYECAFYAILVDFGTCDCILEDYISSASQLSFFQSTPEDVCRWEDASDFGQAFLGLTEDQIEDCFKCNFLELAGECLLEGFQDELDCENFLSEEEEEEDTEEDADSHSSKLYINFHSILSFCFAVYFAIFS